MSKLQTNCVFTLPFDSPTDDGLQAAWRWFTPAGTDTRRVRRETRKILLELGVRNYRQAIRELGWRKHCGL